MVTQNLLLRSSHRLMGKGRGGGWGRDRGWDWAGTEAGLRLGLGWSWAGLGLELGCRLGLETGTGLTKSRRKKGSLRCGRVSLPSTGEDFNSLEVVVEIEVPALRRAPGDEQAAGSVLRCRC